MTPGSRARAVAPDDDPVYRAVIAARDPTLLRAALLAAWKREGFVPPDEIDVELVQVHYKPRTRARMIARVSLHRPPPRRKPSVHHVYLQAHRSAEAARRRTAGARSKAPLRCFGPPVALIPEWNCMAWSLPNGPMLRHAKALLRRAPFRRFLLEAGVITGDEPRRPKAPVLVRYVPRRRAVFRTRKPHLPDGKAHIKLYTREADGSAAANLLLAARAATDAADAFAVPRLLAHVPRRRAIIMSTVRGRRLDAADPAQQGAAYEACGVALAALHGTRVATAARWSAERELSGLRAAMKDVALALPALSDRLQATVTTLEGRASELVFPENHPIHGNMFCEQVLIGKRGDVGIVDWDDLCLGDPLFDVGRLAADIMFRHASSGADVAGVRALLSGYARGGGRVDAARLTWQVATALLMRAKISALRTLPAGWLESLDRAVTRADDLLAGTAAVVTP